MGKHSKAISNDMGQLADDARAFMAATADMAGEKVEEARQRLAAALDSGRKTIERVEERAADGAKLIYKAIRANPYQAIAIAVGVGALLAYLGIHRCSRKGD